MTISRFKNSNIGLLPGKILQIVSVTKTDFFSTNSGTFVDITGFSASITPSSTSSKVLVAAVLQVSNSSTFFTRLRLVRTSTDIFIGSAGTSANVSAEFSGSNTQIGAYTIIHLDAPSTQSATTYKVQMLATDSSTGYLNRRGSTDGLGVASSITLFEVSA